MDARRDLEAVDTRLTATTDAHDAIPVQAPHDALLDFAIALRDSIRGRTENAHSIEDVNRARVASLLNEGLSVRDIADETGISKSTVQRIKKAIDLSAGGSDDA